MEQGDYYKTKQKARSRTNTVFLSAAGLIAVSFLLLIMALTPNAAATTSGCGDVCHISQLNELAGTSHSGVSQCGDCHTGGYTSPSPRVHPATSVNETRCRACHTQGGTLNESHGNHYYGQNKADCTQCHFPNTTTIDPATGMYKRSHNLTVLYNYYNYNISGIPLSTNGGVGKGMFPYYTCSLTCHGTGAYTVEDEVVAWSQSNHAKTTRKRSYSNSTCVACHSPTQFDTANTTLTTSEWKGIQCNVCHNLHNDTYSGNGTIPIYFAFLNATLTNGGSLKYDKVTNATELCEKCHIRPDSPSHSDRQYGGSHKLNLGYTCISCHGNSTFNEEGHIFEVKNTTSGVTSCAVCHNYESIHTDFIKDNHNNSETQVQCEACHDQTVRRNSSGYAVSSDNSTYGIYNSSGVWKTYRLRSGSVRNWSLHNISKSVTCTKCHGTQSVFNGTIAPEFPIGTSGYFVGNSTQCGACHPAAYAYWKNTSHTSKIVTRTDAQARGYPAPPNGDGNWSNVSYAIGGHWKVRYVDNYGYILTNGTKDGRTPGGSGLTQYNIDAQTWAHYSRNTTKGYNCAHCHTTGYISNVTNETREPWRTLRQLGVYPDAVYNNSLAPGFTGYWAENAIGCEACHGQGGDHVNSPSKDNIRNASFVRGNPAICGDCHSRPRSSLYGEYQNFKPYPDGVNDTLLNDTLYDDSPMPSENVTATGGHHEQWEDWSSSEHGNRSKDVSEQVTCVSCHGGHNVTNSSYANGPTGRVRFINGTVYPAAVKANCLDSACHGGSTGKKHGTPGYTNSRVCLDCHMPIARKTAATMDLRSHWFDTNASKKNKNGEPHNFNFANMKNITKADGTTKTSCEHCHGTYATQGREIYNTQYKASKHNKTANSNAPYCTDCHVLGSRAEVVNETTTCRNCHVDNVNGFYERHSSSSDCIQCHFANTTRTFARNTLNYVNDHNMTVVYNYYNYNQSGMPLNANGGTGKGMFPYFTCTLTCHGTGSSSIEDEASAWNKSAHGKAPQRRTYTNASCLTCHSPSQYNTVNTTIAASAWKGVQCNACHNLHNQTSTVNFAFLNATLTNGNSSVYDEMTNATELCEKCHIRPGSSRAHSDRKFGGYHKITLGFTCVSCHGNSSINNESHMFEVKNTTSGDTVKGCRSCHTYPGTSHNNIYDKHNSVTCEACHDNTVSRNGSDYVVNSDNTYGIYKNSSNIWTTYKIYRGALSDWALHNISRNVSCDKCHGARSVISGAIAPAFSGGISYNTTGSLISGYNQVLVLLNPDPAIYARNLTSPATGGILGVTKVMGWNSSAQSWNSYEYIEAGGVYLGTNFTIDGYKAYFLKGNSSTVGKTYTFRGRK